MALLRKDGDKNESRSGAVEAALSIIAAGMRITGDIETNGTLKVDGRIEGSVLGARQMMLGRNGTVQGNVHAGEVVVGGLVDGAIVADERLELQSSAVVNGDIDTKSIVVLEGARINGAVRMQEIRLLGDQGLTDRQREPQASGPVRVIARCVIQLSTPRHCRTRLFVCLYVTVYIQTVYKCIITARSPFRFLVFNIIVGILAACSSTKDSSS